MMLRGNRRGRVRSQGSCRLAVNGALPHFVWFIRRWRGMPLCAGMRTKTKWSPGPGAKIRGVALTDDDSWPVSAAGPAFGILPRLRTTDPKSAWLVQPQPSESAGPGQDRDGEASVEPLAVRTLEM